MSKVVAALDLASSSGLAWGPVNGRPHTRTLVLGAKGATAEEKGIKLMLDLRDFFKLVQPDLMVIEKPLNVAIIAKMGATFDTMAILYGLPFIARMVCRTSGIHRVAWADVQDVRHHFTGQRTFKEGYDVMRKKKISSRQMAKSATMNVCRLRGWEIDSDDAADAAAAWSWGCAQIDPRTAMMATPLFSR